MIFYESGHSSFFFNGKLIKVFFSNIVDHRSISFGFVMDNNEKIISKGYHVIDNMVFTTRKITEDEYLKIIKKSKIDNLCQ